MIQTYVYTTQGRQRPIFLAKPQTGEASARFILTLLAGDTGVLQTTCDPPREIERGRAVWEDFSGGLEGAATQITALRAVLGKNTGWAKLTVQQGV
jgi:hypothetical protein